MIYNISTVSHHISIHITTEKLKVLMMEQLKILMLGTAEGPDDKAAEGPDDGAAVSTIEDVTS